MSRTVIVGDLHGCAGELERLLELVGFEARSDRLVLVGDLVVRGPDPHGSLALVKRLGGRAVRGNHEDRLLSWRHRREPLGPDHTRVASTLSEDEWTAIEALPLWLDLPEHGVRIVHAGVVPGQEVAETDPQALLKMRTLDGRGRWSSDADAGDLWGTRYEGPPHVIFGHNARAEPQLHAWATGLDTGCVYGGRLTALVLGQDEPIPRGDKVQGLLRSVSAARRYHGHARGSKGAPL
jgi:hypothetical protein